MRFGVNALLILFLFCSCSYFQKEKISSETYLEQELQSIDWSEVDAYPLFDNCKESPDKQSQKNCFEITLHRHINSYIKNQELTSSTPISDRLLIGIEVSGNGRIAITGMEGDSLTFATFPDLQKILDESISSLPRTQPALKRGIPVNTRFTMPLVIKNE